MSLQVEISNVLVRMVSLGAYNRQVPGRTITILLFVLESTLADPIDYRRLSTLSGGSLFVFLSSLLHRQWDLMQEDEDGHLMRMLRDTLDAQIPLPTRVRRIV